MASADGCDDARLACERSRFLQQMLDDEERGRLSDVEHYVREFPELEEFVRTEYLALHSQPLEEGPLGRMPRSCGRYQVLGLIGQGGMGAVYEAVDPELQRRVVLKTVLAGRQPDGKARARLRREARVLGTLDHPFVAKITDVVDEQGALYLVMPLYVGRTLAAHLAAARQRSSAGETGHGPVDLLGHGAGRAEALRVLLHYFVSCAEALFAAHEAGVVHRDVKPDNLLVSTNGTPVVLDFGLALPGPDDRLTVAGELLGTPLYMAPEIVDGGAATARSDVWALGVCLYEALTLVHPFAGGESRAATFQRILAGDPVRPRRHEPLLSRDLEAVVLRAIEREPARRYADAAAFARDLRRVLDLEPTDARPVSGVAIAWRRLRRRPRTALVAAVACAAVGALSWTFVRLWQVDERLAGAKELWRAYRDGSSVAAGERLDEVLRAASDALGSAAGIRPLFPRGRVVGVERLQWLGNDPVDPNWPEAAPLRHRYRVEVLAADGVPVWRSEHEQAVDSRWCSLPVVDLQLQEGAEYRWRVSWLDDDGALPSAQETNGLYAHLFGAEAAFVAVGTAHVPPRSAQASFGAWLRALLDEGFASDALSLLLEASDAGPDALPAQQRLLLQRDAAWALGDDALTAAATLQLNELEKARNAR